MVCNLKWTVDFWNFPFNIPDCGWPWVTETVESKTTGRGATVYANDKKERYLRREVKPYWCFQHWHVISQNENAETIQGLLIISRWWQQSIRLVVGLFAMQGPGDCLGCMLMTRALAVPINILNLPNPVVQMSSELRESLLRDQTKSTHRWVFL